MIYQKHCLKLHLLKIIVDEDSEYDDYPYEEHNTYVIDTNNLDTTIENDTVLLTKFELIRKLRFLLR